MSKKNKYTNFYMPYTKTDLKFTDILPEIVCAEEKESEDGNGAEYVLLSHKFYDLNKESKEWFELVNKLEWSHRTAKEWLSGPHDIFDFNDNNNDKQSDLQTHDETKRKWIFDIWYLNMEISDVLENNCVEQSQINKWVLEFNMKLKIRSSANCKFLNKSKILWETHKEYLRNDWCKPVSKIYTLNELSLKLWNEFQDLLNVSNSTISRVLKNDLSMSYRKLSRLNLKLKEKQEVLKLARSVFLLKKLEEAKLELIYFDE